MVVCIAARDDATSTGAILGATCLLLLDAVCLHLEQAVLAPAHVDQPTSPMMALKLLSLLLLLAPSQAKAAREDPTDCEGASTGCSNHSASSSLHATACQQCETGRTARLPAATA